MTRSLTSLPTSAENCMLEDWLAIHALGPDGRMARINEKRDPLANSVFPGIAVECVAGFTIASRAPALVYFWCQGLGPLNYRTLASRHRIYDLMKLAAMLGSVGITDRISMTVLKEEHGSQLSLLFQDDSTYLEGKHLHWDVHNEIVYVALFSVTDLSGSFSTASIPDCIALHNDYFKTKSPVWNSVPMTYLFSQAGEAEIVAKLLLEPKCFNPLTDAPSDWFLWPWQRSLRWDSESNTIRYAPIETTSLVFDLRKSTMALEQLRDDEVGLFSGFIKEVVAIAKQSIFEQGGFFDKETGDGIVAHFTDFALPGTEIPPASVRAFFAAKALIRCVHAKCDAFQSKLRMGVGGLGASVGLHSGKAVWICEKNLVSAYGESVILAARLCGEADLRAAFISNYEFQKLLRLLPPEEVSGFERKSYSGKEYQERSRLFGYELRL